MTPQSLKDPRAEKAAADPLVALWAEYERLEATSQEASTKYNKAEGEYFASRTAADGSEEDKAARTEAGVTALEEADAATLNRADAMLRKIANAPVTSLEGIAIKLHAVAEWNKDEPRDPVSDGVRTALEAVERLAQPVSGGPDDPFPAWLAEWEAAHAAYETGGQTEELDEAVQAAETKIIDAPPRTFAGVVAKLRMMVYFDEKLASVIPDNLVATALAGAESVMRGPGVAVGSTAAGPDPLVALWAKWWALEWRPVPKGLTEEEADRFNAQSADQADDVAAEIVSASPDTLVGLFAQMAVLKYWAENAVPDRADAALGWLSGRIESALQDAARTVAEGGAS